ncbi:MAG: hypothetical protein MJ197_05725 [Bacteroidales bacterium]|nr:hypothetical protein [Bacteroidales bacterium]
MRENKIDSKDISKKTFLKQLQDLLNRDPVNVECPFDEKKCNGWDETIYVDLGLRVLWADRNVGAKNPIDYGDYYSKYNDVAALEVLGKRLPTKKDLFDLIRKCKWVWKGNGYKVIGQNGNSIFLPAAGDMVVDENVLSVGRYGRYWSSITEDSYYYSIYDDIFFLHFDKDSVLIELGEGFSVRLVQDVFPNL